MATCRIKRQIHRNTSPIPVHIARDNDIRGSKILVQIEIGLGTRKNQSRQQFSATRLLCKYQRVGPLLKVKP